MGTSTEISETFYMPKVQRGNHKLNVSRQFVNCTKCDVKYPVPVLLFETTDYRETLYRLYLVASFDDIDCDSRQQGLESQKDAIPARAAKQDVSITPNDKSIQQAQKIAKKLQENNNNI